MLAISLFAGSQPAPLPANNTQMGSYLLPKCKALLRSIDHEQAQVGDGLDGIYCLGFVSGFVAGLNNDEDKVCAVGAVPNTIARVYVAYMEKNPKLLDTTSNIGLYFALKESYPCPIPSK
jgi:hypothetical protein